MMPLASESPILPIPEEILVGSVAFALLVFVMIKFLLPKFEQSYQARVEAIEGGIERAEQAQTEANALLAQYKSQLAEAKSEAAGIRDEARVEAAGIKDDILAAAQEERDRIIEAGRNQLHADRQSLLRELRGELGTLSVELAGRIVGESLADEARKRGTVDRFLSELEAGEATPAGAR